VGAGAAGLLAATRSAERGRRTLLVEKSTKPGVKILMSGGTRCNVTHATDRRGIADVFERQQARFLRSPLAALGPDELVDLLAAEGLATKVESTGKVFPVSDRALDVQRALLRRLARSGARMNLGEGVTSIERHDEGFHIVTSRGEYVAHQVVLATGGQSYPGCGTTGDGYAWAKRLGHSIVPPRPALVPLKTADSWSHELSGITLEDVKVSLVPPAADPGRLPRALADRRGSFLFTHIGLSGPVVLDISRHFTQQSGQKGFTLRCDFLPDSSEEELIKRFKSLEGKRSVATLLGEWLPKRVVDGVLRQAAVPVDQVGGEFSQRQRTLVLEQLKRCPLPISGTLGFAKAEVTAGGISLDEVESRTMASRICPHLFVVGEVLDIDGPIGGYNFQAAFSTGWLAGESV
jgi:predicted Rossmann fold flavoprotein